MRLSERKTVADQTEARKHPENAASTFMTPDPTIDAIREMRHRISASVGHDAQKLVEHYRQLQQRLSERLVSRGTEKLQPLEKHVA